jgi:hypothetical protein
VLPRTKSSDAAAGTQTDLPQHLHKQSPTLVLFVSVGSFLRLGGPPTVAVNIQSADSACRHRRRFGTQIEVCGGTDEISSNA